MKINYILFVTIISIFFNMGAMEKNNNNNSIKIQNALHEKITIFGLPIDERTEQLTSTAITEIKRIKKFNQEKPIIEYRQDFNVKSVKEHYYLQHYTRLFFPVIENIFPINTSSIIPAPTLNLLFHDRRPVYDRYVLIALGVDRRIRHGNIGPKLLKNIKSLLNKEDCNSFINIIEQLKNTSLLNIHKLLMLRENNISPKRKKYPLSYCQKYNNQQREYEMRVNQYIQAIQEISEILEV